MTKPAIPIENIYYLFCYAWNRFEEARVISTGAEAEPTLPNLLAKVLIAGARSLLRRGLDRRYLSYEDELSTVRGHIELGPTLKLRASNVRRLRCTFDELSHDLLHNQLLKASLKLLSNVQTLDLLLARELRAVAARMPDVSDIRLSASAFSRVQLHRNIARYDLLLKICRLVYDSLIPAERGSGYAFQDILRDERKMALIFETFIRNFYRASQRTFKVRPLQLEWQAIPVVAAPNVRLPLMRTDIFLESTERAIIIDTKYYAEALQEHHSTMSFRSENLYQLFAYLRNYSAIRPNSHAAEGMLIYPEVGQHFESSYILHGHQVRFATVNLARPWPEIEARLASLLSDAALTN